MKIVKHRAARGLLGMAAAASIAVLASCGGEQPDVKYARGYVPGPHRVSILGVFKDGRMDAGAWTALAPKLNDELEGPCQAGYDDRLRKTDAKLFATIDEQTEQEGVTPSLLDKLAPRTDAELILVVYEYGTPMVAADPNTAPKAQTPPTASTSGHHGRRGHHPPGAPDADHPHEAGVELAASLFDVREHAFVAEVDVKRAKTADAAADQLAKSFESVLSGSTCASFDWDKSVE
ncbi:MAG TPA: hypothetical protein VGL13_05130 [Polyangiaceae bacterium]|jgi:hypothetical protein